MCLARTYQSTDTTITKGASATVTVSSAAHLDDTPVPSDRWPTDMAMNAVGTPTLTPLSGVTIAAVPVLAWSFGRITLEGLSVADGPWGVPTVSLALLALGTVLVRSRRSDAPGERK